MSARVDAAIKSLPEGDLSIINSLTRREFSTEELYVFPILCCHTRIDRENDRFTKDSLEQMASIAKGVTVIFDHRWSAYGQTARIYKAEVRQAADGEYELVAWAYMPINEKTQPVIDAIDAGILKEVSVGFAYDGLQCSICKQSYFGSDCMHLRGREYDGQVCFTWIIGVKEWYEVSFVAVPAQPGAGVEKSFRDNMEDEKKKQIEGGKQDMNLIEYLKSLGVEAKDDQHAFSLVKEWKEKADAVKETDEQLKQVKSDLEKTQNELKQAKDALAGAPDSAMAAAGQKFFEETRNEIVRIGGILGESTKSLEIIMKGVTDIDALLEIKKEYQERLEKQYPPTPQTRGAAEDSETKTATGEIDLKEYTV